MTAKYFAILTNYGAAQLANAVALGTQMNISAMAVGDGGGTLPVPDPAQTKLIRETRRAAVNQVSIDEKNPNFIITEQVIPENEGGWFIREIGLFDDNGGLIAVGNAPETYKPNLQEGSGRTQVIQMVLMVSSTQAITLKIDPSVVLATREYVTKSIDAAIQASEDRAAQTYQPKGDYVTNPYLKIELLKKIDKADIAQQLGNDTGKVVSQNLLTTELGKKASVADANSKLAKDQNGADIPDKPKFIENLGLSELFSPLSIFYTEGGYAVIKTGEVYDHFAVKGGTFGSYNPQVDQWNFQMPVTGPEQTVGAYKNRVMSQFAVSEALKKKLNTDDVVHGTGNSESKVISQKATTVAIDEIYSKMFGVGMTFRDVTAERTVGTNYVNSSLKPRVIYFVGMPAQATTNTLTATGKINDKTVVQFKDASATAGDIRSFILVVPPGASYSCHSASHTVSGFNYWFEWE